MIQREATTEVPWHRVSTGGVVAQGSADAQEVQGDAPRASPGSPTLRLSHRVVALERPVVALSGHDDHWSQRGSHAEI